MVKKDLLFSEGGYERPQIEVIEIEAEGSACIPASWEPKNPGISRP